MDHRRTPRHPKRNLFLDCPLFMEFTQNPLARIPHHHPLPFKSHLVGFKLFFNFELNQLVAGFLPSKISYFSV